MKPAPLDCTEVQAQLPLYAGRDLEAPLHETVADHLGACGVCTSELRRLQAALDTLSSLRERVDAPIDVWSGVRASLAADGHFQAAPRRDASVARAPRPIRWSAWRRLALPAAAAAAIVVAWTLRSNEVAAPEGDAIPQVTQELADSTPVETIQPVAQEAAPEMGPSGGLRRATGEERMRDMASPFFPATNARRGLDAPWSLASDHELR